MIPESFVRDAVAALGEGRVFQDAESLERFSGDAFARWRVLSTAEEGRPDLVARPATTEEVATLVSLAKRYSVPVVPYGGGTGVMGAAVPVRGGLVLDLKGLGRIVHINRRDRTVQVQAGVVLEELDAALNREGLMLGHDPYSVPIATVAGTISTNGVGYRAARYGAMGEQVLGLEVVLPTGEVLRTRPIARPSSGPDLKHLFIGAEGTLGIITEATLRVFVLPETRTFHTFRFPDFEQGFDAVQELTDLALRPAVLDLTEEAGSWESSRDANDTEVTLYLAFEGFKEEVAACQRRASEVCLHQGGKDLGPQGTEQYWNTRHDSAYRYREEVLNQPAGERRSSWGRGRGAWDYLHMSLPASQVVPFYRQCRELLKSQGIHIREAAVWTEPERFSLILADERGDEGSRERMTRASDQVLSLAQDLGGGVEYCHGVGLKLVHLLERELGVGLETVRRLKKVLDPNDIMNPGKLGL